MANTNKSKAAEVIAEAKPETEQVTTTTPAPTAEQVMAMSLKARRAAKEAEEALEAASKATGTAKSKAALAKTSLDKAVDAEKAAGDAVTAWANVSHLWNQARVAHAEWVSAQTAWEAAQQ